MTTAYPILVIGGDAHRRNALVAQLVERDFWVIAFGSTDELHRLGSLRPPGSESSDESRAPLPPGLVLLCALEEEGLEHELSRIAAHQRLVGVPVLVLAYDNDGVSIEPARAFALGAADVVREPFDSDELSARIAARLSSRHVVNQLERQHHGASMVLELTQALSSTLHIRDILAIVVRRIAEVVVIDRVSLILGGGGDDTAFVIAASDDARLRDLPIRLSEYPEIGKALQSGEPIVIEDATTHPLFNLEGVVGPRDFRSLTLFPILFEDRPMGVLFLRNHERRQLSDEDIFLVRAVANATGIALRNAKLLRTLREESRASRFAHFEAEQRMKALERYHDFFNSIADGIVVVTPSGDTLFCNPAACEILGRREEQLVGQRFEQVLADDAQARFRELKRGFASGEFSHHVDLPIIVPPNDARRVLSVSFNTMWREDTGVIISLRDVTRDRATARELTKTKQFLQRVIDSSVDAIVSADMSGKVLLFNPAAERTYGYRAEEVIEQMNVRDLYPPGGARQIMKLMLSDDGGEHGMLQGHEAQLLGADGDSIPVRLSAALIIHRGRPIGSVGVFRDLRDRHQIEERLKATEEELALKEKQAILAELAGAAAHELNQPLTTVMGYASMVARQLEEDSRLGRAADSIVREAERMAEIVRKIGKITKYETKTYIGDTKILDFDRSIDSDPPATGL